MDRNKTIMPYKFIDNKGTFRLEQPENVSYLYFPVAGEQGIKGALTPTLGGDLKCSQNEFILQPVSAEELHNNKSTRNFWCWLGDGAYFSVTGASAEAESRKFTSLQDKSVLTAGPMWHEIQRKSERFALAARITSFVPVSDDCVEIMHVEIKNEGSQEIAFVPTAAIPLYGRSADNLRDHRHVTSLLHRAVTTKDGVFVTPTLSFDERGHQRNDITYYVCGMEGDGTALEGFMPVVEDYIGEGGSFEQPESVIHNQPYKPAGEMYDGYEIVGALRFARTVLQPGESRCYTIFIGADKDKAKINAMLSVYNTNEKVLNALEDTRQYWQDKINVSYETADTVFDNFMYWVNFQPMLRRIYGCSFLPHHDYGKGGRGWRDLWQDCLALLIMNPNGVRQMLIDNYGGVRIDGSNATIIGSGQGEFIADRNNITRVWMDHGLWPLMTTKLYIDQTGDLSILLKVRGADWNDALDMASERGESVAFTAAYADNLNVLAELIQLLEQEKQIHTIEILEEMVPLLQMGIDFYEDIAQKKRVLEEYCKSCFHQVSGRTISIDSKQVCNSLLEKAQWLREHIRRTEWIEDGDCGWFNSYYDNHGRKCEGKTENGVRMMLTGQVFAVMSGTATKEQTEKIIRASDRYLYQKEIGGYRLNTDFGELKTDLGRMFGFAYGHKENGAVFSHMTTMYANALYRQGFAKEGYIALHTLYEQAVDFTTSRIYPGIPEYFNDKGRGMYHYLTGAASWMMLTVITEMFGVKGRLGSMVLEPKLQKEQFMNGRAAVSLNFGERRWHIIYVNQAGKESGEYKIAAVSIDGNKRQIQGTEVTIPLQEIQLLEKDIIHEIIVELA